MKQQCVCVGGGGGLRRKKRERNNQGPLPRTWLRHGATHQSIRNTNVDEVPSNGLETMDYVFLGTSSASETSSGEFLAVPSCRLHISALSIHYVALMIFCYKVGISSTPTVVPPVLSCPTDMLLKSKQHWWCQPRCPLCLLLSIFTNARSTLFFPASPNSYLFLLVLLKILLASYQRQLVIWAKPTKNHGCMHYHWVTT